MKPLNLAKLSKQFIINLPAQAIIPKISGIFAHKTKGDNNLYGIIPFPEKVLFFNRLFD